MSRETVMTKNAFRLLFCSASLCFIGCLIGCGSGGGNGGGGNGGGGGGGTPTPTVTVTASPTTITLGQPSTVTIITTNATTCSGSGSFSGSLTCNGTVTVTPTATGTATYTVTATNSAGSASASTAVTVTPVALPTLTMTAVPTTITLGQSVALMLSNATGLTSCTGAGSLSGTQPCSGSITVIPTATGTFTYEIIGTGPGGNVTASATVTVTTAPVSITSVTLSCTPSTISAADTATCTVVVNGTGNFDPRVTWKATGGTVSALTNSTAKFTPSGAGTGIVTATSTQDSTKSSTASAITITAAVPKITSISLQTLYADAEIFIIRVDLNGSGSLVGDTVVSNPAGVLFGAQYNSSSQISPNIGFDTPHTSPGWFSLEDCQPNGGICSNPIYLGFLGPQNLLAILTGGEMYSSDLPAATIWKFKPDGTSDGTLLGSEGAPGIAIDDKTSDILVTQRSGASVAILNPDMGFGSTGPGMGVAARNGVGCITQPSVNYLSCMDLTQANPTLNPLTVGSQPVSVAMGLFGTETDAFVFTRDGNPILWKVDVSGGSPILKGSVSLTGMTPAANLYQKNPFAGGWHVVVFDSGPASGTAAALSTADNLLLFVDTSTMTITKSVTLPGVPFRIAVDKTHGKLIVAFADPVNVRTTFASVDPTTGTVTPLTTTSDLLAVGFQVSPDGKSLYACMRDKCEVLANK